jgi:4-diphosphocytidyl-2-C-methyl-D-erythritol kinase
MKKQMTIQSYAKLNLALAITGVMEDGFHSVDMIMQEVSLHDTITLQPADTLFVDCGDVCAMRRNTAYKAAELFFGQTGLPGGVSIHIQKRIPARAGLGGGSSNAAAVLLALNKMFDAALPQNILAMLAAQAGSDVPFFLHGGCMRTQGRGEVLSPLPNNLDAQYLLVKPGAGVSTAQAYRLSDTLNPTHVEIGHVADSLSRGDAFAYFSSAGNALYPAAQQLCPPVSRASGDLKKAGADFAMMTGSGSCVFGVFTDPALLRQAEAALKSQYPFVQSVRNVFRNN